VRVSEEEFNGRRSASAIKNQRKTMKDKHTAARQRLNSTGEGQRDDDEKWASMMHQTSLIGPSLSIL
jgi:hypothetical protein